MKRGKKKGERKERLIQTKKKKKKKKKSESESESESEKVNNNTFM